MDIQEIENQKVKYMEVYDAVQRRWDSIAKPIDSLGLLEDSVAKLCAIVGESNPYILDKKAVVALCADHGVCAEGVTQTGQEVTRIVAENFAKGCSSVNHMSKVAGADVFVVDMGMASGEIPEWSQNYIEDSYVGPEVLIEYTSMRTGRILNCKCAKGTKNLAAESAMTIEQCQYAMAIGKSIVWNLKHQGYKIIATGEMGIGNTTPTSVLAAKLLGLNAEQVTGRGAGLDDAGLARKREVVRRALERIKNIQLPELSQDKFSNEIEILSESGYVDRVIQILAEVGGYEIATMVGMYLGGVKYQIPIVIDGAISTVAALVASKINPLVPLYAMASHVSEEGTGKLALDAMELEAIVHGRLCLGEGTGAVTLYPLLDMALAVYSNMGTFADLEIDAYERSGKPQ